MQYKEIIKNQFVHWLENGNEKRHTPEVCVACVERTSEYIVNRNMSQKPIWLMLEHSEFSKIHTRLLRDKQFYLFDKKNNRIFEHVGYLYSKFLVEEEADLQRMVNSSVETQSSFADAAYLKLLKENEELKRQIIELTTKKKRNRVEKKKEVYSEFKSDGKQKARPMDSVRSYDDFFVVQNYFLNKKGKIRDWAIWTVGVSMGLGVSDLMSLKVGQLLNEEFSFKKRFVIQEKQYNRVSDILITESIIDTLTKYFDYLKWDINVDDYLFRSQKKGQLTTSSIHRLFSEVADDLNFPYEFGTSSMRKSFVAIALSASMEASEILAAQKVFATSKNAINLRVFSENINDEARVAVSDFVLGKSQIKELVMLPRKEKDTIVDDDDLFEEDEIDEDESDMLVVADKPVSKERIKSDNKRERTIPEAISAVLQEKSPLTIAEIYDTIIEKSLYAFNAINPLGIISSEVRRHCVGEQFSSRQDYATSRKMFKVVGRRPNGDIEYSPYNGTDNDNTSMKQSIVTAQRPSVFTQTEERVLYIFKNCFTRGLRAGFVDLQKLMREYKEMYGLDIDISEERIVELIKANGFKTEDAEKYTHIDNLFTGVKFEEIELFITEWFGKGYQRVFIEPLFEYYKNKFSGIVNKELFAKIVERLTVSKYKVNRKSGFISQLNSLLTNDINDEIRDAVVFELEQESAPLWKEEIYKRLMLYPVAKIEKSLHNSAEIVNVKRHYYHVNCIFISEDEKKKTVSIIAQSIADKGFISADSLYGNITELLPDIISNNEIFNQDDMIKAVAYVVRDTFKITWRGFEPRKVGGK